MSISAVSSTGSTYQTSTSNSMDQMKKNFDALGSALSSGNLDDAKKALKELQKNAPKDGKTPSEITDLQKALDSGDMKAAQQAYTKIQQKSPQQGEQSSQSQSAQGDTVTLSSKSSGSQSSSSSSNQTYDKKDANKDGTVSAAEELSYDIAHPTDDSSGTDTTASSSTEDTASSGSKKSEKSSATASKTYDKMDTNKDGTVTAQEKSYYEMKHISDTTSSSSTSPYSGKSSIKTYA